MIARVFPRRTHATPTDEYSLIGNPDMGRIARLDISEVHISVTFTWDVPEAKRLEEAWSWVAPVKIGGPAIGDPGGEFIPGRYLKPGYVITSRGCPNHCWFCQVPKREGGIRELRIQNGVNVLDSNILATSETHQKAVFEMLSKQKGVKQFTGGLEAKILKPWQADAIRAVHAKQVFFAYDTPDDWEPLENAARMMFDAGFTRASKGIRAYVLMGYPRDTFEAAKKRVDDCLQIGVVPMAMVYMDQDGKKDPAWAKFQRQFARAAMMKIGVE